MLKICVAVFSATNPGMLFKLGRCMSNDLLKCVIENQDPASIFLLNQELSAG